MKHLVEIDDKTIAGKRLLGIVQTISEQNAGVVILDEEADTISYEVFAKELRTAVTKRLNSKKSGNK
jgi:hypothetical protein